MNEIKKNEKFRFPAGGDGSVTVYKNLTAVEASGSMVLVNYDDNPDQFSIFYHDGNTQRVLTHAHVFAETGGDGLRGIAPRKVVTASEAEARKKFVEIVAARKEKEAKEAAAAQAAAVKQEAAEKAAAIRTRKILEAKRLRDETRSLLKDAVRKSANFQDDEVQRLIGQFNELETYLKFV